MVKTAASHAVNMGSNPVRVTKFPLDFSRKCGIISKLRGIIYIVGVDWGVGPPVPIPNTEVKHSLADDTCRVTGWENR